jgi:hypothetical protein
MAKYKLDLVVAEEVKWNKGGAELADNFTFFYRNGNADHQGNI